MPHPDSPLPDPLVLYDGSCGFCHGSVQFLLRRERGGRLRFAALDSPTGHAALKTHGLPAGFGKSVVLIEDGRAYLYSTAVIKLAGYLQFPWRLLAAGRWIPRPVRDAAYRLVARYRGKLAGKVDACAVPEPAVAARFVDVGCGERQGDSARSLR